MRVAFVSQSDPRWPDSLSGAPYSMLTAMRCLVDVSVVTPTPTRKAIRRAMGRAGVLSIARKLARRNGASVVAGADGMAGETLRAQATHWGPSITDAINRARPDVVFVAYSSAMFYALGDVKAPIVYWTDATAHTIREYPAYRERSDDYLDAYEAFERAAMDRSEMAVFPARHASASAVTDYGVPEASVRVVPLGCNVSPSPREPSEHRDPPSRDDLRLSLVGLDPVRKGLDCCIDAVQLLRERGVRARLDYIGPPTPRSEASEWVSEQGRLRLSNPADRAIHSRVLRGSHFFMLPSKAEAFGIAAVEAAIHGTPGIVRGVGGLAEVVRDGQTGYVIDPEAGPEAYADAAARLLDDPEGYGRMAAEAQRVAEEEFTWAAWAKRVVDLFEEVLEGARGVGAS